MNTKRGIKLRFILSILVIGSTVLTLIVCAFSALQANRQSLAHSYLDNNQQYAEKLAFSTKNLLLIMQQTLEVTSLQYRDHSIEEVQQRLNNRWDSNKLYFNSMIVVDKNLAIKAITPQVPGIKIGDTLSSKEAHESISQKRAYISAPYHGFSGKFIILVSVPIFDSQGAYQGFVGGTIYLEEDNALSKILSSHFYGNGSYVFVVDQSGEIIFHPESNRIGQVVTQNPVVQKVLSGQSGAEPVINSQGNSFFAGYAYESFSRWGIISQTPKTIIEGPARDLVFHMIKLASPFFLLILIFSSIIGNYFTKPLSILAKFSEDIGAHRVNLKSETPEVKSVVYEIRQLYHSLRSAFQQIHSRMNELSVEVQTDALTGLANRRTFDLVLDEYCRNHSAFSLIMLDVDHFKWVNDVHGHLTGDDTLRFLAKNMREISREEDLCFRYGGEEFAMIIPTNDLSIVTQVADRLRRKVETTVCPAGHPITISLGIAIYPEHGQDSQEVIAKADEAMYQSKSNGRNLVTVYSNHMGIRD